MSKYVLLSVFLFFSNTMFSSDCLSRCLSCCRRAPVGILPDVETGDAVVVNQGQIRPDRAVPVRPDAPPTGLDAATLDAAGVAVNWDFGCQIQ